MFLLLHPPHRLEWKAFIEEADAGEGSRFPKRAAWGIPIPFIIVFIKGYIDISVH